MKRLSHIILLFIVQCTMCISGLQAQEAFYVYRNDGDFNGFFYDEIVRMGYSKVDFKGEEHDEYVIQEIETADSLYRIPLCAIDSISFVQPEIRFNPRLKIMDNTELADYFDGIGINGYNEYVISFKPDLPEKQIPVVGDVLIGLDEKIFYSNNDQFGCAGTVREIDRNKWGIYCIVDPISDFGDIFDQLITVEQIGTDENGNVRRRVAGFNNESSNDIKRRAGGNYDLTLLNWSGRLQADLANDGNASVNVGLDLGFKATAQAVYQISGVFKKRFFMKLVFNEEFSAGLSAHIAISSTREWPIPTPLSFIPAIKFPTFFPLFEVDPVPEGFFRIGGTIDAGLSLPSYQFGFSQTYVIDTEADHLMTFSWGNLDKNESKPEATESQFSWLDAGVVFNGFMQGGAKVQLGIKTNSWLASLLQAGISLDIYAGPKAEMELNLKLNEIKDQSYNAIKDSKIELSAFSFDRELKYSWMFAGNREDRTLWSDTQKSGTTTYYLYPDFLDTEASYDETTHCVKATVRPRRQVVKTSTIGIGIYDNKGTLVASRFGKDYGFLNSFNEYTVTFSPNELEAGTYKVRPLVKLVGDLKVPVIDAETEVEVLPYVKFENDKVVVSAQKGYVDVGLETNMTISQLLNFSNSIYAGKGTTCSIFMDDNDGKIKLRIEYEENKSALHSREMVYLPGGSEMKFLRAGSGKFTAMREFVVHADMIDLHPWSDGGKPELINQKCFTPESWFYRSDDGQPIFSSYVPSWGEQEGFNFTCNRSGNTFNITGTASDHYHKVLGTEAEEYDDFKFDANLKMTVIDDVENDTAYIASCTINMSSSLHNSGSAVILGGEWVYTRHRTHKMVIRNIPLSITGGTTVFNGSGYVFNCFGNDLFESNDFPEGTLVTWEETYEGKQVLKKASPANPHFRIYLKTSEKDN